MHLLQNSPDNRGMITICDIRVTVEMSLRECYQAMPLEAVSQEVCLRLALTVITFRLVKIRYKFTS